MSETVEHNSLDEAMVAFQAEVGTVAKDADNPFFKSKYADLPAVKAAAQPFMSKHGLAVTQKPSYIVVADKVVDTLITEVVHKSGQRDASVMALKNTSKAQEQGSAITYARRYAFMSVLGLVADDDDDGNAASGNTRKAPAQRRSNAKPAPPEQSAEVREALTRVQAAAKAAGVSGAEATAYFKETHKEDSLIGSSNVAALTATAEHYEGLANAKNELGATEVKE